MVYLDVDMYQNLLALIDSYNREIAVPQQKVRIDRSIIQQGNAQVQLNCKVAHVGDQSYGKLPKDAIEDQILMEYEYLFSQIADYLPTALSLNSDFKNYLRLYGDKKAYELSDFMMMTLPSPRISYYQSSDYYEIQKGVTGYANEIIESLGFFPVRMQMEVLGEMETFSQAILFLGLIFDIIILLFVILSILLIYSLLMISVETKTFEFGVMRMVGLTKTGIINMIVIQSFMFVIPSVIFGFMLSVPTLDGIYSALFTSDMNVDAKPIPSEFAIIQALIVGLVIPLASSVAPIQSALKKNLNESLDIQRSKTQAIFVEILDSDKQNMSSYIVFGLVAVVYGLSIYYFLPLAMLSFNFALVLKIFFFILVGMLFGLSLLAFNLQRFLEIILVYVFFFWEKQSMRNMILKNLTAHKLRNKMTSIIYSLALGFIIFLIVSYNLQIKTTQLQSLQAEGSYLLLSTANQNLIKPDELEKVVMKNMDIIESFSFVTPDLRNVELASVTDIQASDHARINSLTASVFGIMPSQFESSLSDFMDVNYQSDSGLPLGEQLYSAKGS
mmetsp:Transcript_18017/g.30686  ORF Transcript_18017/g.30686 Transcript_18017/m.30686 type:complete len:557 (+) Transcript_18017:920-2590(+)